MQKTVLGNTYLFDKNYHLFVMKSFSQQLKQRVDSSKNSSEIVENISKIVDQVAVGGLLFRLSKNEEVPFEDEEWLDLYYFDVKQRVIFQGIAKMKPWKHYVD